MFKVSEEIYLAASDSANHSKTYGVYQKSNNEDEYGTALPVFVAPEVTEVNKLQVLHLPDGNIIQGKPVEFFIRKNGARGNLQVKLVNVKNQSIDLPLKQLDPDRHLCRFTPESLGVQKIRIYFNTVEVPCSPIPLYVRGENAATTAASTLSETPSPPSSKTNTNLIPVFQSNALNVRCNGAGVSLPIHLNTRNELTVDASEAGNNILFVAVSGPNGQCDNLAIRHLGKNIYNISFTLQDNGKYVIIVNWGEESVPGSPFQCAA